MTPKLVEDGWIGLHYNLLGYCYHNKRIYFLSLLLELLDGLLHEDVVVTQRGWTTARPATNFRDSFPLLLLVNTLLLQAIEAS